MISILILTLNEEDCLEGCLKSVEWSDDIHVWDSFSSDRTQQVALAGKANFYQHKFTGYASQRNAALKGIKFKYPWVLLLDADERVPTELASEMQRLVGEASSDVTACRIPRRDYLWNTWLKRAQLSRYYIRLVRPNRVHYEREVNEVLIPNGEVRDLSSHLDHFPFSKGIAHWIDRHNRYSTMEAAQAVKERKKGGEFSFVQAFFAKDFNIRRYHQKGLYYKMPLRPIIKWNYMVFGKMCFLDGYAGICYSTLQSIYEYFIILKEREIERGRP